MDKTELHEQHIKTKTNNFKQTYLKSPQYTHLEEKLVNFYNQPAAYLNYLLEYVFKNHKDYYTTPEYSEYLDIKNKENAEKFYKKLKKLNQEKEKKLKEQFREIITNIRSADVNKIPNQTFLPENAELQSEVVKNSERIENIIAEQSWDKYNVIISSKGDYINNVLNDRDGGEYTMEHLTQNAMNCLKDPKGSIEKPKREFFKIEDVKLSNDELCEGRKEFMLRRNKKKNTEECRALLQQELEKTIKMKRDMFNAMYENANKIDERLLKENEQQLNLLLKIKKQMTEDRMFDNLTFTNLRQLGFYIDENKKFQLKNDKQVETNVIKEETITKEIDDSNKDNEKNYNNIPTNDKPFTIDDLVYRIGGGKYMPSYLRDWRKDINDNKTQKENEEDKDDKTKKRFGEKAPLRKGRCYIETIGKRVYYNDNPYHYRYRYDGSSIKIHKQLEKVYDDDNTIKTNHINNNNTVNKNSNIPKQTQVKKKNMKRASTATKRNYYNKI
jgi:hypothetical protein